MNPTPITQQRLSEESTTESSTSVSGDSEADRQTDEDLGSSSVINASGPWATEEEFMEYALTIPKIAGRYTDADPAFRDDVEDVNPPILKNYTPRKHDRDRPQGGGRNHSNYHGQSQGHHHGNNRGYSNQGNYYRNHHHNRHGGQGSQHYKRPRSSSREDERNESRGDGRSGGGAKKWRSGAE